MRISPSLSRGLLIAGVLLNVLFSTSTQAQSIPTLSAQAQSILANAEELYPTLFKQGSAVQTTQGYLYKAYAGGIYVGFKDGHVFVLGGAFGNKVLDQGTEATVTAFLVATREKQQAANPGSSGNSGITSNNADVPVFKPTASADLLGGRAFTMELADGLDTYTFVNSIRGADANGTSNGIAYQSYVFMVRANGTSIIYTENFYDRGIIRRLWRSCNACKGVSVTRTANGKSVNISLTNTTLTFDTFSTTVLNPSTTPLVVNGSISGEVAGG